MTRPKSLYDRALYKVDRNPTRQGQQEFDRQRFENYTAWYDNQTRAMQNSAEHFRGLYDENCVLVDDKFDSGRSDPFHYPNMQGLKQSDHYKDYRSGSRHPDIERMPQLWRKMDHELKAAIPEKEVEAYLRSKMGEPPKKEGDDPTFKVLFIPDTSIKPPADAVPKLDPKKPRTKPGWDDGDLSPRQKMLLKRKGMDADAGPSGMVSNKDPQAWKQFKKVNPVAREIFKESSMLLRCQQGIGVAPSPKKVFVPGVVDDKRQLDDDRVKLKYPGGHDAMRGIAGTWSVEHDSCPGLGQFATPPMPITSTVWDYV